VMLYAYYKAYPLSAPESGDKVFPHFIVGQLPHGIAGLVIAAIFAAAMSNLSGSLNSLSSSTAIDFYKPLINPQADDDSLLKLSKWFTVGWGLILIAIAIISKSFTESVLNTALSIASVPYGAMLGAFLLGVLTKRTTQIGVMVGMATSLAFMLIIKFYAPTVEWLTESKQMSLPSFMLTIKPYTVIAWTWYVLIGTVICYAVGYCVSLLSKQKATSGLAVES